MPKTDLNKQGWEDATRFPYSAECKVCTRPFTQFRWNPGSGMRPRKTEICQTCAKIKNICQSCLLDLQYGLPVQVRDAALQLEKTAPQSAVNREYYAQNMEGKLKGNEALLNLSKVNPAGREILKQLARTHPYEQKNRPHICSFYVKGNCNRGNECPYRHELPIKKDGLASIRDRYYGTNDPIARKLIREVVKDVGLIPPFDKSIASFFLTEVDPSATEQDIRSYFSDADIKSIILVSSSRCGFVNFATRKDAEEIAEKLALGGLSIDEHKFKIQWAKPRPKSLSTV